jgi:hypothetical protein
MMARCYRTGCNGFEDYGGRGILVCDPWHDFEVFLADMGPRPKGHSIERKDVNGNYEPMNCKWLPDQEQALNRRNTRLVEFRGESLPLAEAARRAGIRPKALLRKLGLPLFREEFKRKRAA